jgi:hypothetical protein
MGVRGLTSFCYAHEEDCCDKHVELYDVTLAVDTDSFLSHACEQVALEQGGNASWLLLGGTFFNGIYV